MTDVQPNGADALKERVKAHWETETCGTRYGSAEETTAYYRQIREARASLEPWILPFQDAPSWRGKRVLEIGTGAGSDFVQWALHGADATGIDLTDAAISATREHLASTGADPERFDLRRADAEALPFTDASFDLVYSYGVLHHSPDTPRTLREACRVLRPGGTLRIMLYHCPSWTAWMLWAAHYALRGRPFTSPRRAVYEKLESPGTKCYTVRQAKHLLESCGFIGTEAQLELGPGDLLRIAPSARYASSLYRMAWKLYPRPLVRLLGKRFGIILLLSALKAE